MPWGGFYYTLDCLKKKREIKTLQYTVLLGSTLSTFTKETYFQAKIIISQKTVSFDNISQEFALLYLWNIYFFNIALYNQ